MNKTNSNRVLVRKGRWKHVSAKKESARERGIFVNKKPSTAGGLESSKAGCCFLTNNVLCLESGFSDRCPQCATYKRIIAEMEKEDSATMDEFDEIRRTGVHPL
jgi:hypothetical protein